MPQKVVLIIIDGCRPDGIQQATTPHIDALWQTGAYTWAAQSVQPSISLPAHMSMFRGVAPDKHRVMTNVFNQAACAFSSVIDLAHQARLASAMFYEWETLRDLSAPGSLSMSFYRFHRSEEPAGAVIAQAAAEYLADEQPDLCILYLVKVDEVGHAEGWMSPPYLAAIAESDKAVGEVLAGLDAAGVDDSYTILVVADHGGEGHDHSRDTPGAMTIPWIINGAGIKRGHAIQTPVVVHDTAATIAHILGIARPDEWDGKPVYDAFD